MSTPQYFQQLPNIKYAQRINKAGVGSFVEMKDFFRLMRVRDDIYAEDTLYYEYVVQNGQRPEQISYELYGDERYYWMILQVNDIYDYWNQWPLDQVELENYVKEKWGNKADDIAYYETPEVKNDEGTVLLEGGLVVPQSFIFYYHPNPSSNDVMLSAMPSAVTNRQDEVRKNEKKASINVIQKKYVYDLEREWNNYARRLQFGESATYIP